VIPNKQLILSDDQLSDNNEFLNHVFHQR
jgi:hypothetical protein